MGAFAAMFSYLRKRSGKTQQELADELGLSKSAMSMYENGNREPPYETLEAIADYFNVDINFLLGIDKKLANPIWDDEQARENMQMFQEMNPSEKEEVLKFMRYVASLKQDL